MFFVDPLTFSYRILKPPPPPLLMNTYMYVKFGWNLSFGSWEDNEKCEKFKSDGQTDADQNLIRTTCTFIFFFFEILFSSSLDKEKQNSDWPFPSTPKFWLPVLLLNSIYCSYFM